MGHVHLSVADVPASEAFYCGVLGFEEMARLGDQATFLGAGGYHHHLGGNVWNSRGAAVAGPGPRAALPVELPDAVRDGRAACRTRSRRDDGVAARPLGRLSWRIGLRVGRHGTAVRDVMDPVGPGASEAASLAGGVGTWVHTRDAPTPDHGRSGSGRLPGPGSRRAATRESPPATFSDK